MNTLYMYIFSICMHILQIPAMFHPLAFWLQTGESGFRVKRAKVKQKDPYCKGLWWTCEVAGAFYLPKALVILLGC